MSKINDGGPAFPVTAQQRYGGPHPGLTLRDWFAGQALAGLLPKMPLVDQQGVLGQPVQDKVAHNLDVADSCYWIADAMLAARTKHLDPTA